MNRSILAAALALAGCTAAPEIVPAPDRAPLTPAPAQPGPNDGWCNVVGVIPSTCTPDFPTAHAICVRALGEFWGENVTPIECWHSIEAAPLYGCVPVCVDIVCEGAESDPSTLMCCPWA